MTNTETIFNEDEAAFLDYIKDTVDLSKLNTLIDVYAASLTDDDFRESILTQDDARNMQMIFTILQRALLLPKE